MRRAIPAVKFAVSNSENTATPGVVLAAVTVSLGLHVAAFTGSHWLRVQVPQLPAFNTIEVALLEAAPAVKPEPPAAKPAPTPPAVVRRPVVHPSPRAEVPPPVAATVVEPPRPATPAAATEPRIEARFDAAVLNNPNPPYPLSARRRGLAGNVLLRAQVLADGSCANVTLRQTSGHEVLDQAALETVRKWRFLPARQGQVTVDSWVDVPINFKLET